jgi:hypothetical protein
MPDRNWPGYTTGSLVYEQDLLKQNITDFVIQIHSRRRPNE